MCLKVKWFQTSSLLGLKIFKQTSVLIQLSHWGVEISCDILRYTSFEIVRATGSHVNRAMNLKLQGSKKLTISLFKLKKII